MSHWLLVAGMMLAPMSKCSVPGSIENEILLICIIFIQEKVHQSIPKVDTGLPWCTWCLNSSLVYSFNIKLQVSGSCWWGDVEWENKNIFLQWASMGKRNNLFMEQVWESNKEEHGVKAAAKCNHFGQMCFGYKFVHLFKWFWTLGHHVRSDQNKLASADDKGEKGGDHDHHLLTITLARPEVDGTCSRKSEAPACRNYETRSRTCQRQDIQSTDDLGNPPKNHRHEDCHL